MTGIAALAAGTCEPIQLQRSGRQPNHGSRPPFAQRLTEPVSLSAS